MRQVKVTVKGVRAGFGTVFEATITVTNPTETAVKDFEITCRLFAASGTEIDEVRTTLYEAVPPNATKTFRKVNFGFMDSQTTNYNCRLTGLELVS